ncbi:MAG TPA: hypothetical protein VJV23_07080 [Candidatus Polarisedimenticolia bacterium]|nr:hypothetical protein [Candidatus Polarisedimenticolia bacterium]
MTRALALGVLALLALSLIARAFPGDPSALAQPASGPSDAAPFAPWDGAWEGAFNVYQPDGTRESSVSVRQRYVSLSPTEQNVEIVDRLPDGSTRVSRGRNVASGGRLECRIWEPDGTSKLLVGRRLGRALLWHRRDDAAGVEETFREEILLTPSGELYTIDGYGLYGTGAGRRHLLFEGRYRRAGEESD